MAVTRVAATAAVTAVAAVAVAVAVGVKRATHPHDPASCEACIRAARGGRGATP